MKTDAKPWQPRAAGFSTIEILVSLAILGILTAGGASVIGRYGSDGRVEYEANALIDHLWELRASASTGMKNPCLDFPDAGTVRLFSDMENEPDGFGSGDRLIRAYKFSGAVRVQSAAGGTGRTHFVCFRSEGVTGSAGAPLVVTLGSGNARSKIVRLLPSTGTASLR